MLIQIYKSKGCFQDLTSFRNIHLKEDIVKFFGALVMREAQDTLNKNVSKFQIGAKSGHRASEHIYVLKTVLRKYEKLNKPIIVSLYDYSVFFDSESIIDVMDQVYRHGIRGKIYRLLYKLNEDTIIRVSTPVGVTGETSPGEGVG